MKIRDGLDELRKALEIDRNSLDLELVRQPQLFLQASELLTRASARRDFLKEEIDRVDATLYGIHRKKLDQAGSKATEGAIKAAVEVDAKHQEATKRYITAKETADLAQGLKDSFHQRRYMLQELCGLIVANYFESSSAGTGAVRDYKANRAQNAMAEKRARKKE